MKRRLEMKDAEAAVPEEQSVRLNEIAQVALTVNNLPEAREFYRETLGMQFLFDAGTMAFFQCGATRLMVGTSDKPTVSGGTILYFRVPDIHAAHAILKSKGVPFVQEAHLVARMKSHDLWLAFFTDPSGNTLGLMSEASRTPTE
jgi:methylmalonyl-CoA/ethylmalonyl-CoA epimerase